MRPNSVKVDVWTGILSSVATWRYRLLSFSKGRPFFSCQSFEGLLSSFNQRRPKYTSLLCTPIYRLEPESEILMIRCTPVGPLSITSLFGGRVTPTSLRWVCESGGRDVIIIPDLVYYDFVCNNSDWLSELNSACPVGLSENLLNCQRCSWEEKLIALKIFLDCFLGLFFSSLLKTVLVVSAGFFLLGKGVLDTDGISVMYGIDHQ
jgi:hypothetical protein